jgi:hypothetical protein
MKIIKRINNRDYSIKYAAVPRHKLPDAIKKNEMEKDKRKNSDKIDFTDVTFMIPVRIESDDRRKCLTIVLDYLVKHFNTNILVLEEGPGSLFPSMRKGDWDPYLKYIYRKSDDSAFYKTLNLNLMAKQTTTNIICALDSDCLFHIQQYVRAVQKIRDGRLDFCYPFNQPMYNITKDLIPTLESSLDLSSVHSKIKPKTILVPPGGCFFMNKQKFIEGGMENQHMISYGPEDTERRDRFMILGYKVGDTEGPLFHIDHSRTTNSNDHNPFFKKNKQEYEKVRFMSKPQLQAYVSTWLWIK